MSAPISPGGLQQHQRQQVGGDGDERARARARASTTRARSTHAPDAPGYCSSTPKQSAVGQAVGRGRRRRPRCRAARRASGSRAIVCGQHVGVDHEGAAVDLATRAGRRSSPRPRRWPRRAARRWRSAARSGRRPSSGSSAAPRAGPARSPAGTACRPCTRPGSRAPCAGHLRRERAVVAEADHRRHARGCATRARAARRARRSPAAPCGRSSGFEHAMIASGTAACGQRRRATRTRGRRASAPGRQARDRCAGARTGSPRSSSSSVWITDTPEWSTCGRKRGRLHPIAPSGRVPEPRACACTRATSWPSDRDPRRPTCRPGGSPSGAARS